MRGKLDLFKPALTPGIVFNLLVALVFISAVWTAREYPFSARLFPWAIGIPALILALVQLVLEQVRARRPAGPEDESGIMDLPVDRNVPTQVVVRRSLLGFGWVLGLLGAIWLIGYPVAIPLFVLAYLVTMAQIPWWQSLLYTLLMAVFLIGVFHYVLLLPWFDPVIPWPQEQLLRLL